MKKYKKKKPTKNIYYTFFLILALLGYSVYMNGFEYTFGLDPETITTSQTITENTEEKMKIETTKKENNLTIQYLDVGQADAILIQLNEENMLIDAGNNNDGKLLVEYFQSLNITDFKYVVGTHPHEDHIGGMDNIIDNFNIKKFYIPDVITTTATFTDVLDALERKNMQFNVPKIGNTWNLGDAKIEVLYTGTDSNDLNSTSIVLKLTYGKTKFLFTGDAPAAVEKEIIKKDLNADVLKVAHHGSSYSSTSAFLKAVSPQYAIISCGNNNKYGHPTEETLKKLNNMKVEIHRTDKEGTIMATSNGEKITFTTIKTNVNGG